ncbi:hypothetical protein ACP26L_06715 [Paenibacillus sp. S-38]|uniref:hypothetical protein n=1 Tax=Paenibacillus sp. S-38 TaxID=3416710 RepID=UPI003CECB857
MKRINFFLLIIITATILISCGKEPTPIPKASVTTAGNISLTTHQMGSFWNGKREYSTRLILKDKEADVVPANSQIKITYDIPPKENTLDIILWPEQYTGTAFEKVKLENNSFTVPADKGLYIYSFRAQWAGGDEIEYGLKIQVE